MFRNLAKIAIAGGSLIKSRATLTEHSSSALLFSDKTDVLRNLRTRLTHDGAKDVFILLLNDMLPVVSISFYLVYGSFGRYHFK